jgi:hypothetical protein
MKTEELERLIEIDQSISKESDNLKEVISSLDERHINLEVGQAILTAALKFLDKQIQREIE